MNLKEVLSEKKPSILKRWFDVILETYPADTAKFLKTQRNPFANPVGSTISKGIENIFDELLEGGDRDRLDPFLDNIIRIRAVQDFTPAQALAFIFLLKKVIRDELDKEMCGQLSDELSAFESKIDDLALLSFDIYMKCREKLYDIKANEVKSRTFRLLQRAKLITDTETDEGQEQGPDLKGNNLIDIKRKEATK